MRLLLSMLCGVALSGCQKKPEAESGRPDGQGERNEKASASAGQSPEAGKGLLVGIVLKPVRFHVPAPPYFVEPPDFVAEGGDGLVPPTPEEIRLEKEAQARRKEAERKEAEARKKREAEWNTKHEHRMTLPAHVFAAGEGRFAVKAGSPESQPGYVRAMAKLREKADAGDWEGMKSLFDARLAAKLSRKNFAAGAEKDLMGGFKGLEEAEVMLILQTEGVQLAIVETADLMLAVGMPIDGPGDEYRLWDAEGFSENTNTMLRDMQNFLGRRRSARDLIEH